MIPMDMILLAAGNSSRFGENKLLYEIDGRPLVDHALERAVLLRERGRVGRVILVTQYDSVAKLAEARGAKVVRNDRPDLGISRSLQLGLARALEENADLRACLFGVCDQPYIKEETIDALIELFETSGKGMAACAAGGNIGNPVIFSERYFEELMALSGDVGGKRVLRQHTEDAALLETDPAELEDLDICPEPVFFQLTEQADLEEKSAEEIFPFLADGEKHVISLVGGGGKSTLMNDLSREFLRRDTSVVKTTTTHILCPGGDEFVPVQSLGLEEMRARLDRGLPVTVGTPEVKINADGEEVRKLTVLSPLLLASVIDAADVTLIEADGAKRLPMKVPADHEPVIHPATDVVIAVLGMRAVGRPLEEVCFRASRAAAILEVDKDHTVTPEDFAKLFLSSRGGKKNVGAREYICIINQCDSEAQRRAALPALRLLREAGVRAAVAGR